MEMFFSIGDFVKFFNGKYSGQIIEISSHDNSEYGESPLYMITIIQENGEKFCDHFYSFEYDQEAIIKNNRESKLNNMLK